MARHDAGPALEGPDRMRAAVAAVLAQVEGALSLLYIRRAEHEGDPWSGDLAFPGGRLDPEDATARAAAERETLEEVGFALDEEHFVGRLADLGGRSRSVAVSGFVYVLDSVPELRPNYEVSEAFWFPLEDLRDEERQGRKRFTYEEHLVELPAVTLLDEGPPLWGLTYEFTERLMQLLGRPIPAQPWDDEL